MELTGPGAEVFGNVRPGQFAQLDISDVPLPAKEDIGEGLANVSRRRILLRRPFSLADVVFDGKGGVRLDILYRVLGPATLRMTSLEKGDKISIIGPLGNGFAVPEGKKEAILVAGGVGAAPLEYLAKFLKDNHTRIEVTAFAGARTVVELPFEVQNAGQWLGELVRYGVKSFVATDDGSAGFKGAVTDCLRGWLRDNSTNGQGLIIYGCGPEAMLSEVARIADKYGIDCQVSLERMMGCGIGLCQGCVVECRAEKCEETVYKLCCKDGPVFESREVVFGS